MSEAAGALTDAALAVGSLTRSPDAVCIWHYIEYDVVWVRCIGDPSDSLELIEPQSMADPPGDHMVGARCVAANADATYFAPVPI